jgi:hypothetical protein
MIFGMAQIDSCGRGDPAKATLKFCCGLGKNFEALFARMKWQVPADRIGMQKLDGKLSGSFVLRAEDKLVQAELSLDFKEMSSFQCLRLELERKKGKGFRRELRFNVVTEEEDALAKIEAYMQACNNSRGSLQVDYIVEPEQTTIPDDTKQTSMELAASEGADDPAEKDAVKEIIEGSKGSLASAREMQAGKRKRLGDDVQ